MTKLVCCSKNKYKTFLIGKASLTSKLWYLKKLCSVTTKLSKSQNAVRELRTTYNCRYNSLILVTAQVNKRISDLLSLLLFKIMILVTHYFVFRYLNKALKCVIRAQASTWTEISLFTSALRMKPPSTFLYVKKLMKTWKEP